MSPSTLLAVASLALNVAAETIESGYSHHPQSSLNPITLGLYSTPELSYPISLEIKGKIPHWVTGSLYRGAAGSWDSGNYSAEHWFDGFTRNHRFEISNGQVQYRNRNSSDEIRDFVEETGLYPGQTFAGDPCKVIFGAFQTTYRDGNNPRGNTSSHPVGVSWIANFPGLKNLSTAHGPFLSLTTTTDGNELQQIDPITLEPVELYTYQASNPIIVDSGRTAAHPAHGSNGELYNYILDLTAKPPAYNVFHIDTKGAGHVLATIKNAPPAYIHSLFSTANYLVLIVWQADFGSTPKPTYNLLDTLKPWNSTRHALFYVIDKVKGGVVSVYTTPAFFAFHEINSFEDPEDGSIVIDLPFMADYSFLEAARLPNLRANVGRLNTSAKHDIPGTFTRFRLPGYDQPSNNTNGTIVARPAVVDFVINHKTGNIELPCINQAYHGKDYQYAYGVHIEKPGYFADSIIKVDTKTQKTKVWNPRTNHMPSEPIFVAHPNATEEEDGVLLTVALDAIRRTSALVVIDAKDMEELARAEMPLVVGYGFHGIWGSS